MRKIISILLCMAVLFGILAPCSYASDSEDDRKYVFENAVSFFCRYDADNKQVIIDGTVDHDVMIDYDDYFIHLVSILPGESESSVLEYTDEEILAKTSMTIRFTFYIDANSVFERFSEYAIVFVSPEGERFSAGTPKLPSVSSDFSYDLSVRDDYKGILTDNSSNISSSGAGTVIVDFYMDEGLGDSSDSYIYPMGAAYGYIKKSYIDEIDKKIVAASLTESKVYIRLLLHNGTGVLESLSEAASQDCGTPNVYSEYVLERVFAITEFLTDRYNGENGNLFGFILGTKIDKELGAIAGKMSAEEYADLYTLYLVSVGSAARVINNTLDIVMPISDDVSKTNHEIVSYRLVENIVKRLDNNVSGDFDCSIMVESEHLPSTDKDDTGENYLTANELDDFIAYLDNLSSTYDSAPIHVIYKWKPDDTLNGSELCCAYIYSYIKLLNYGSISSFVLDVSGKKAKYPTVKKVFECIDTWDNEDYINGYAEYIGADSWNELIEDTGELPIFRTVIKESFTDTLTQRIIGEFCYMDFSSSSLTALMTQGENCTSMTSAYDKNGDRLLQVSSGQMDMGEWFEMIERFDYPENYYYTPIMSLEVELEDKDASEYALYELCLTFGNENARIDVSGTVRAGERLVLYFDVSEFADLHNTDYFKLSARCLTEDTSGISLLLHNVSGYSSVYNSDALAERINEFRASVREEQEEATNGFNMTAVIAIFVSIVAVGVGLFMVFRRDDEKEEND